MQPCMGERLEILKELQDLQHEAEALKRYRNVLDDRLLEAMIAQEDAEAGFTAASNELDTARLRFSEQSKTLTQEKTGLTNELARLESEREAAVQVHLSRRS